MLAPSCVGPDGMPSEQVNSRSLARGPFARDVLRHAVRPNILPGVLAIASSALIMLAGAILGFAVNLNIYSMPMMMLGPATVFLTFAGVCVHALYRDRPARPAAHLWWKSVHEWKVRDRLLRGAPVLVLFPLFFGAFTSYKSVLGKIVPFYFDPYAIAIDAWMHTMDPWRLLHPLLGFGPVTFVVNFFYNLWFLLLYAALAFVAFIVTDLELRSRYLVCFVLCWMVIGIAAATALSSAGPCFYLHFFASDYFGQLMGYLNATSAHYAVPALEAQSYLLSGFGAGEPGLGRGITAAPSMHVSIAVLNALLLSRFGRFWATAGWGYAAIIFLGSVHLGWHYAIDGYIAGLLTWLLWVASGKIATAGTRAPIFTQA
jgi:PAP2 superfamily